MYSARPFDVSVFHSASGYWGLAMLAFTLCLQGAYGQSSCPFPDSVAVADTLDPKGYYPIWVGDMREYLVMNGGFMENPFREEIIGDTLVDGMTFYKLKITAFEYDFSPVITRSHTHFSYIAVVDSGVVQGLPDANILNDTRFFEPFNSCYETPSRDFTVSGGYDAFFSITEGDSTVTHPLAAVKTFSIDGGLASITYGYGVGPIQEEGDVSVITKLSYAWINGQEFGTPLDSLFTIVVSTEEDPPIPRQQYRLENYPNPFKKTTRLVFSLTSPGRVSVRIMDILGRVIAQPLNDRLFTSGNHTVTWEARGFPAGLYLTQLVVDGHIRAASKIILAK